MKKNVAIFLTSLMMSLFSITAFAETSLTAVNCKEFSDFYDENEFLELITQAFSDSQQIAIMSASAENTATNGYKEFMVSDEILTELANGSKIDDLLPTEYKWVIPFDDGGECDVAKRSEKWEIVCSSRELLELPSNHRVDVNTINSAINVIQTEKGVNVLDVVCMYIPTYHGEIVCITTENEPYLISFNPRPEFTGLENGKLYDLSEANDILYQHYGQDRNVNADILKGRSIDELTFDEILQLKYGGGGSGSGEYIRRSDLQNRENAKIPFLPIILIPAAIIAVTITILLLVWNRRKAPKNK